MMKFPDVPPVWLLAAALLSWLLSAFVPLATIPFPNWLGWFLFAAGLAWAASANVHFIRNKTPVQPGKHPTVLLDAGPFRVNRNPIYTGMTVMLVGWAIVLGTLTGFLPALAFPFLITRRFIVWEEAELVKAFGKQAEDYFARTRRW